MMELNWDILYKDESTFPRLLQFGDIDDNRFRYGINELLQHNLYFYFPPDIHNKVIEPVNMANVSFHESISDGHPKLVLTLLNSNLKGLFDDLIISLVSEIRKRSPATKGDFIMLCNEWFELFDPGSVLLNKSEIQGIFSELHFLKYLLRHTKSSFNEILKSWLGPYGKAHDFELGNNLFEIKSCLEGSPFVRISSEYQLDFLNGQQLFLSVCEFNNANTGGVSVGHLVNEIAILLRTRPGINMNLFWSALRRLGLSNDKLENYEAFVFNLKSMTHYKCSEIGFPSIRRSLVPDAIRNIKYELTLNLLSQFKQRDIIQFL